MIRTAPLLITGLLLIASGIGADTPDHMDADGDIAGGPIGIVGVSTDSGERLFVFDLHVDSLDFSIGNVRYVWDLRIDGDEYEWSCDGFHTYNGPRIDCLLVDKRQDTTNDALTPAASGRIQFADGAFDAIDPTAPSVVPATHHLDLKESTVGFTLSYDALGLHKGDTVTLLGGAAHFTKPSKEWIGAPADAMVVGQDVVLR